MNSKKKSVVPTLKSNLPKNVGRKGSVLGRTPSNCSFIQPVQGHPITIGDEIPGLAGLEKIVEIDQLMVNAPKDIHLYITLEKLARSSRLNIKRETKIPSYCLPFCCCTCPNQQRFDTFKLHLDDGDVLFTAKSCQLNPNALFHHQMDNANLLINILANTQNNKVQVPIGSVQDKFAKSIYKQKYAAEEKPYLPVFFSHVEFKDGQDQNAGRLVTTEIDPIGIDEYRRVDLIFDLLRKDGTHVYTIKPLTRFDETGYENSEGICCPSCPEKSNFDIKFKIYRAWPGDRIHTVYKEGKTRYGINAEFSSFMRDDKRVTSFKKSRAVGEINLSFNGNGLGDAAGHFIKFPAEATWEDRILIIKLALLIELHKAPRLYTFGCYLIPFLILVICCAIVYFVAVSWLLV